MEMKKSDILMLSYVIFLAICLAVRAKNYFPQWDNLVVGVTISGTLLAVSDALAREAKEKEKIYEDFSPKYEGLYNMMLAVDSTQFQLIDAIVSKEKKPSLFRRKRKGQYKHEQEAVVYDFCRAKKETDELKERSENAFGWSRIMTFIAFLALLCFSSLPLLKFEKSYYEMCTVLAFLIIILTSFCESQQEDTIHEKERQFTELSEKCLKVIDGKIDPEATTHAD